MTSLYYQNWQNHGLEAPKKPDEVRDWAQSVGLEPLEDYLIDSNVRKLCLGLGWDYGVDVDASAALFTHSGDVLDLVWWHKLQSNDESVKHSGDDRTGEGGGDDETIRIDLDKLHPTVHHVLLAVCIYSQGFSFQQVRRAYVRMLHGKPKYNGHLLCSFSLSEMQGNAMIMGLLTRRGAYWNFRAMGMSASGRTIRELVEDRRNLEWLTESPSWDPVFRRVQVQVIRGEGLAAKDRGGFFHKTPSSDPYYKIKFKKREFKSHYIEKSLDPIWPPMVFDLGWISEAERKALKIQVFDFDAMSDNEFMGAIWIPGNALYNLGAGIHQLWFQLTPSKKAEYRTETVSGKIELEINVFDQQTTVS
eukprot:g7308.t1